jgi:bifunctional DNA-binding transcriptional regulator/antitoxin component of YhaV-PrlF toxin-antitoxin module
MTRIIARMDSKRRLTFPAPWVKPGDFFEVTYVPSEDALVMRPVKPQANPLKVLKKAKKKK